jgi:hypothetical protein
MGEHVTRRQETEDYNAGGFVSGGAIVRALRPIRVYSPEEIAALDRLAGNDGPEGVLPSFADALPEPTGDWDD